MLSWCDILDLRLSYRSLAEVSAEKARSVQIDPAAENPRQLLLHREKGEPWSVPGLEFNQHVHVAVGAKVVSQNGAEQCELADAMPPTKFAQPLSGNFNLRAPHPVFRWSRNGFTTSDLERVYKPKPVGRKIKRCKGRLSTGQ
jgi:hypothetical protein